MATKTSTPASRPDSEPVHYSLLTGLRGFAALSVVIIHVTGRTDFAWFGIKAYGPIALFVLSGFLLYPPWARWALKLGSRPGLRSFAVRRVARIFPAYLVVFLVIAVVYPASQPPDLRGWLHSLTLTQTFIGNGLRPGMEQVWSLGTELTWYFALPVLGVVPVWLARRYQGPKAVWIVAGALAMSLPITVGFRLWIEMADMGRFFTYSFWLPSFLVCFAAGATVALFNEARKAQIIDFPRLTRLAGNKWLFPVIGAVLITINASDLSGGDGYTAITFTENEIRTTSAALLAVLLLVFAVFGDPDHPWNRLLRTRPAVAYGRWSYGIYLWHLPLVALLVDDFNFGRGFVDGMLLLLSVGVGSAALAALTWSWVEQPAINWSRSYSRRYGGTASRTKVIEPGPASVGAASAGSVRGHHDG